MRAFLILATLASAAVAEDKKPAEPVKKDEPKKDDKMKKHELSVSFATPNSTWKATISEVRVVGKELWVKVDVTSAGGIAPAVIGKAEAKATVEAADLPVKYGVFGKNWNWKNEDKDIIFVADLDKEAAAKLEKEWKDGKVVYEAKKDEKPKKDDK